MTAILGGPGSDSLLGTAGDDALQGAGGNDDGGGGGGGRAVQPPEGASAGDWIDFAGSAAAVIDPECLCQ